MAEKKVSNKNKENEVVKKVSNKNKENEVVKKVTVPKKQTANKTNDSTKTKSKVKQKSEIKENEVKTKTKAKKENIKDTEEIKIQAKKSKAALKTQSVNKNKENTKEVKPKVKKEINKKDKVEEKQEVKMATSLICVKLKEDKFKKIKQHKLRYVIIVIGMFIFSFKAGEAYIKKTYKDIGYIDKVVENRKNIIDDKINVETKVENKEFLEQDTSAPKMQVITESEQNVNKNKENNDRKNYKK